MVLLFPLFGRSGTQAWFKSILHTAADNPFDTGPWQASCGALLGEGMGGEGKTPSQGKARPPSGCARGRDPL